jgi:hypothetical protein
VQPRTRLHKCAIHGRRDALKAAQASARPMPLAAVAPRPATAAHTRPQLCRGKRPRRCYTSRWTLLNHPAQPKPPASTPSSPNASRSNANSKPWRRSKAPPAARLTSAPSFCWGRRSSTGPPRIPPCWIGSAEICRPRIRRWSARRWRAWPRPPEDFVALPRGGNRFPPPRRGLGPAQGEAKPRGGSRPSGARRRGKERHATRSAAEFQARVIQERRSAGTVGDDSSAAATAERCRRRPGRRPKRSRAHRRERAQRLAGLPGTALRPSPRCLGASSAVPASAGPCGPGRGSGATAAAGRPTGAGTPTRRAVQSAATAATPAAVEARPATLPGAAEGRGTPRRAPRRERQRTRATAGSMPAAFRAGHCTAQAVRPARPLPYRRTGVPRRRRASGGGGATGLVAHSDTRTRKQTACQLRWRDVCRRGVLRRAKASG